MLHGDLWSGNIGSVGGQPSVFDPAVYYGHSEAEFGMSWCAVLHCAVLLCVEHPSTVMLMQYGDL